MKFEDKLKRLLIARLGGVFARNISLELFNEIFIFLDKHNTVLKVIPYGVFENSANITELRRSGSGRLFDWWLGENMGNLEKDFNKARKLRRQFDKFLSQYHGVLPYNLESNNALIILATALFVHFEYPRMQAGVSPKDEESFIRGLSLARSYIAGVFFIDSAKVNDSDETLSYLVEIFLNTPDDELLQMVVDLGLMMHYDTDYSLV